MVGECQRALDRFSPFRVKLPIGTLCCRVPKDETDEIGGVWMDLKPLGDRLIVQALEEEDVTESGIVLPDTAKEKPQRGRVLAVGPGPRNEDGEYVAMELSEGDEIIFSKYGGTDIKLGAEEYLILRESDVLAKVVGTREPAGAPA
jgi:chaperonin GroES